MSCIAEKFIGCNVVIRTNSAGVQYGELESVASAADGYDVVIKNARRVYKWRGAFTLSEFAMQGVVGELRTQSKLSMKVDFICVRAIEVIPMRDEAVKNLQEIPNFQP